MRLIIKSTRQFEKDLKKIKKRKYKLEFLEKVIDMIAERNTLPEKYKDHNLTGEYKGFRECHIQPDWLLIYKIEKDVLILTLARTGTHSDLF